jgi:hypothetical protein
MHPDIEKLIDLALAMVNDRPQGPFNESELTSHIVAGKVQKNNNGLASWYAELDACKTSDGCKQVICSGSTTD